LYVIVATMGVVLPYAFFVPFPLDTVWISASVEQMFANRITSFFSMDVIVSTLAVLLRTFSEGRRHDMKHLWVYPVANLTVGVSLALPLFLLMRERRIKDGH
jgi:hypothetical protein